MKEANISDALDRIAEEAVPESQDLWPAIHSQIGASAVPRTAPKSRALGGEAGRRRLRMGVAAALVLALAIAAAAPLWNHRDLADAQVILERAQATVNGPVAMRTYHLKMTEQVTVKGNATVATEIWYGGPTLQRNDERVIDSTGAIVSSSETVFNGEQVWIASTGKGETQVIHTVGTTWNAMVEDPEQQQSLTDVLARYSNDKACMDARLQGDGTVAGQASYVIVLTPRPAGCDPKEPASGAKAEPAEEAAARASKRAGIVPAKQGSGVEGKAPGAAQDEKKAQLAAEPVVTQITVWVDKTSLLPLKTEVLDPSGSVLDRSEVTAVEYNVAIPDTVFTYTAPAGASVFNFSGGTGADVKAAMCRPGPDDECAPATAGEPSPTRKQ